MTARNTDLFGEIRHAIEKQMSAFDAFKNRQDQQLASIDGKLDAIDGDVADLRDRIETLESRRNSPGKVGPDPLRSARKWNEYATPSGTVFELPNDVKMADAIKPAKPPAISLGRWLGAAVLGEKSHDAEAREYVRELQAKTVTTGTSGLSIPTEYLSQWLDMIRAASTLVQAGAVTVTMLQKTQTQAAVLSDPTPSWHTEAAQDINASDPTFAARTLTAKTLAVRVTASVEATQDSPDFAEQLSALMTAAMAGALDKAGLVGTGGTGSPSIPEPAGILGLSGVNTVAAGGALTSYDKILDMIEKLLRANVKLADIGALIVGAGPYVDLARLKTGLSNDLTPLQKPPILATVPMLVTTGVETSFSPAASNAFLGNWKTVRLGMRREASIEILKTAAFASSLTLEFVGYLRADWLATKPSALCTLTGIS